MGRQTTAWRYTGRGGPNAGRGNGQSQTKGKQKEMRFATQEQMTKGYYSTYNDVKDTIVTEVQKRYEYGSDIAKAIRSGQRFDIETVKPTRGISKADNTDEKKHEQDGLDILYQEELRMYLDRKKHLRDNELKAYSLIISNYCTTLMKTRIEEHPEYLTTILDNPVELLEKIKTLTHDAISCLLYTSPSPRDATLSRMPSSA